MATDRSFKIPGPDHQITIETPAPRVIVTVDARVIADTRAAVMLHEAGYPTVYYLPREDIDMAALTVSATRTWCPYKGEACYFGDGTIDIAWSYETPFPAVADIAGMLAFYPARVAITLGS